MNAVRPAMRFLLSIVLLLTVTAAFSLTTGVDHNLVLNSLEKEYVAKLGVLSFVNGSWVFDPSTDDEVNYSHIYCIGVEGRRDLGCINYKKLTANDDIWIYTDKNNDIQLLSIANSGRRTGLKLFTKQVRDGPVPKLRAKKVEKVHDGSTKIKEEAEPEPSFIQKYWMYIVPPLIIFMIVTDNGSRQ